MPQGLFLSQGFKYCIYRNLDKLFPEEKSPQAKLRPEAMIYAGGDGGELNSPSKRSCPEYTTSLVSSFVLPD